MKCGAQVAALALVWPQALLAQQVSAAVRFEVRLTEKAAQPVSGRLFVIIAPTNTSAPRTQLGRTDKAAPTALAVDVTNLAANGAVRLDDTAFQYPPGKLRSLPAGQYSVQAVLDCSQEFRAADAPGNWYSSVERISLPNAAGGECRLRLTEQVPKVTPKESELIKFVRLRSDLLSRFHGHDVSLRAGVVLPADYGRSKARYPLWIRVGGYGTRYTAVEQLMGRKSDFRKTWMAKGTAKVVLLQLDGVGPYGDPYYVNSANNGPYGDALVRELIPYIEQQFRVKGEPQARFISGTSTGGWVALALQIFYPEFFNGAWSSCPDPVDFHALELINIYSDTNAFVNRNGYERASERNVNGETVLSVRHEVGYENVLGRGNSYTCSGQQWGSWNAVFSPRGPDGAPVALFDPITGAIDPKVAEHWKRYDLRLILSQNWTNFGARVSGKLHISAGEADAYFLNNAVHLLDQFFRTAQPRSAAAIAYGLREGHGWSNVTPKQMLREMEQASRGHGALRSPKAIATGWE